MNETNVSQIQVEFIYSPVINFSLQQNHVPIVKTLTITNTSEVDWGMVLVQIETEPNVILNWKQNIPLIKKQESYEIGSAQLSIDSQYLAELTEKIAGYFTLTVSVGDICHYQDSFPFDILAYDQWNGIAMLPELLISFVTPNHPEIARIIRRASLILEKWTGNPSFDEYQSKSSNRVRKQMAAIYEAIVEMQLTYCSAPASFEQSGQRIRLVDNIVSYKLANCLDLTLLYAGCLEALGIHPLIIIIKGHCFAGGWLVSQSFSDPVYDDPSLLTKRVAEGINDIVLVESTCMNTGNNHSFDQSCFIANQKMSVTENFILFIDVKRARFSVRPLPLRIQAGTGWVIQEETGTERETKLPDDIEATEGLLYTDKVKVSKQQLWERKLLDLTLRNSLLNIRVTKSVIQFITINPATLEDALASGNEFQVLSKPLDWDNPIRDAGIYRSIHHSDPISDLVKSELSQKRIRSYLTESDLADALISLFRSSRLSLEENGANTLYIGLGLLKWYETQSSEKARYAPLLLMPVEIIRKSAQKGYVVRGREEETIINITLLEMIRHEFGVAIGGLETLPKDESGVDVKKIFTIIRQAVMSQSRWDVEENAIMGSFSFSKFILWNDIHHNHDKLRKNKVVESLISGKLAWAAHEEEAATENLDQEWLPSKLNIPISFDSSQLEAIIHADMDRSFVLHGPPGTGKSQTITNIIANALYAGKKVLFVAAKKAALEVVQDRLNGIGIGPFCLELHSNKSKKSAVIEQLREATQIIFKDAPKNYDAEAQRLATVRTELNVYVKALHQKHSFGFSLYEAFNAYVSVNAGKDSVSFPPAFFRSLTSADFTLWNDLVQEMQTIGKEIGHPKGHALELIHIQNYSTQIKEQSWQAIESLLIQLYKIKKEAIAVRTLLSFNDTGGTLLQEETLSTLINLLFKLPDTPASLFQAGTKEQTVAQIIGIADHGILREIYQQELLGQFHEAILAFPAEQALTDWRIASVKWFLPRWSFRRSLATKLKRLTVSGKLDKQQIPNTLEKIIRFQKENNLILDADYMPPLLDFLWQKGKVNWEQLKIICGTLLLILHKATVIEDSGNITGWRIRFSILCKEGTDSFLSIHNTALSSYLSLYQGIIVSFSTLNKLLGINFNASPFEPGDWVSDLIKVATRWLENINGLKDWHTWLKIKENLLKVGLQPLVTAYENGSVASAEIIQQYQKGVYRSAAEYIIESNPALTSFNGRLFEDKIKRFREISKNFESLTKEELYAKLASRVPSFTQEAAQSSEIGILQKNIRNNGRATSIRRIFDEIPNLLHRLTPCMLMSPISVAQYFDANSQRFDLVIFDEASQLPTCEAISAIARAKNVIVVGDPKQLPPTSFFTSNNIDDDNIEKEDLESILDDCLALSMPSQHLLWHYRSKHESLIAFSNAKYYNNKLLTFPSIDDIRSKVEFVPVKGTYDRGKTRQNFYEAKAIVEEVVRRLSDPVLAMRSIGIVTFSSVQQILIEDLLNDVFTLRPDLEKIALEAKEPIFIKNLENVQGDERDVILFSICYGPDAEGKVSLTLGPLTREGGWRRLNVAVSRARFEMKIFSTLKSDQIDIRRTASEGISGLRDFLAYAEKGRSALPIRARYQIVEALSFENLLADEIRQLGFEVHTQIGCSGYKIDLGIVNQENPGEYILGILCDGKNYYSSKTARDREIVQVDVLKLLGWTIFRVWSTEWWEKPEAVIGNIMESIRVAKEKGNTPPIVSSLIETTALNSAFTYETYPISTLVETVDAKPMIHSRNTRAQLYEICSLEIIAFSDSMDFLWLRYQDNIISQIEQVLTLESPISRDLLCKRVLDAWGIARLGSRISAYFEIMFAKINVLRTEQENNTIFWKGNTPDTFNIYRIARRERDKRNADDLPAEEIANGVLEILRNQISLSQSDMVKEAANLFGYSRIGTNVELAISMGIRKALDKGFGYIDNNRIILKEGSY